MSKICVDDKFTPEQIELIPNRPVEGETYTIRKKLLTRNGHAYLLNEITNPPLYDDLLDGTFEPSFSIIRFQDQEEELSELTVEEILEDGLVVA